MDKKIHNLKHMEYLSNFDYLSNILLKQGEKKKTEVLDKMMEALIDINYYITGIYKNELYHSESLREYRHGKLRAIERARKAEERVEELEKEIKKLKKEKKLGL